MAPIRAWSKADRTVRVDMPFPTGLNGEGRLT